MNDIFEPEQSFVSFDGTSVTYKTTKNFKDKRKKLVILHGLGGDLSAWDSLRMALYAQGIGTVAMDLRGHGRSGRSQQFTNYTLDANAKDVLSLIAYLQLEKPLLLGHCFGGMVALHASLEPEKLGGLLLVNTTSKSRLKVPDSIIWLLSQLARFTPISFVSHRPEYSRFTNSGDFSLRRIWSDICHTSVKSYCFTFLHVLRFDLSPRLSQIKIPTIVVKGTKDVIFHTSDSKHMHQRIPQAKIHYLENVNHTIVFNAEATKKLLSVILDFHAHVYV